MVLFFLIPASLSGFFYYNVIQSLLAQEKRIERNRALSYAFALSWIFWIVCWTPNYVFGFLGFRNPGNKESYGSSMDSFLSYFFVVKTPLQLLYSQLNVLVYLVVLQKFQDYHAAFFKKLMGTILYKPVEGSDTVPKTGQAEITDNQHKFFTLCGKAKRVSVAIIFGVLLSLTVSTLSWQYATFGQTSVVNERLLRQGHSSKEYLKLVKLANLKQNDVIHRHENTQYRTVCAAENGELNFNFKRCFFQLRFSEPGWNFTRQVEECRNRGAILTYPRDEAELEFLWNFFEEQNPDVGAQEFAATFMHMGFIKSAIVSVQDFGNVNSYTSVDEKMVVTSQTHPSMFYTSSTRILTAFDGAAICLTKTKKFSACMPRDTSKFSICSLDFL